MSLLVCLLGADGLVLATDSRGTFGDPRGVTAQNDLIKKLYLVNERVGIMVAGAGDLGSTVVAGFLARSDIASLGVTELTMALHRYVRKQFGLWFPLFSIKPTGGDTRPARPDLNFIVCGYEVNEEPSIYRMSSSLDFAPMLHNYGFGIDGVAQYALYLLNRLYDRRAIIEDLQYLAAYVITETASQDGKVGGPVQIATIGAGKAALLSGGTVEKIVEENKSRSLVLKQSFLVKSKKAYSGELAGGMPGLKVLSRVVQRPETISESDKLPSGVVQHPETLSESDKADPVMDAVSTVAEEMTEEVPAGLTW